MPTQYRVPALFTLLYLTILTAPGVALGAEKVIIDTDPGVDDSLAIVFALKSKQLEVLGLTTIFGNVETHLATLNSLRLLEIMEKNVPVAEGASRPLYMKKLSPPADVHGEDGLGEINLPLPKTNAIKKSAAEFIVQTVMDNPGEVTLIVLGPMTNIALALALEPDLSENVKQVVAMGGVLQVMGNVSPVASANILGDPHAADIVMGTDWNMTLVSADITRQVLVTDSWWNSVRKKGGTNVEFLFDTSRFYRTFYQSVGYSDGYPNHDSTAVAYVLAPELFETDQRAVRVVTDGMTIGHVVAAEKRHSSKPGPWFGVPLSNVTVGVDVQGVQQLLEATITKK
jgi:inosine-uridine nucleoside N-ribohydrolase|tara:strand:- start:611 stop:1636 length:1026 start_codon:yes stop_codon:yes gene_type:complete